MLIKDNKLDVEEFKSIFNTLTWIKAPRHLSPKVTEYFYIGTYEDADKIIKIKLRPSKRLQITESTKGHDKYGNKISNGGHEFGQTIEVLAENSLIEKIHQAAKPLEPKTKQVVNWE